MKTINAVKLRARLSKDAELKTFRNGGSFARLIACTENKFKNRDGEWQKQAEFHTVVVRGRKAIEAAKFLKGEIIDLDGRIVTRSYEVNGEKRHVTEIITWDAKLAEGSYSEQEPNFNRADSQDAPLNSTNDLDNFWNR